MALAKAKCRDWWLLRTPRPQSIHVSPSGLQSTQQIPAFVSFCYRPTTLVRCLRQRLIRELPYSNIHASISNRTTMSIYRSDCQLCWLSNRPSSTPDRGNMRQSFFETSHGFRAISSSLVRCTLGWVNVCCLSETVINRCSLICWSKTQVIFIFCFMSRCRNFEKTCCMEYVIRNQQHINYKCINMIPVVLETH